VVTEENAIALVTRLICRNRHLEPSQVSVDTNLVEDLGFDSLDAAELLAALHKETGRQLSLGSMSEFRTVSDIAQGLMTSQPVKVCEQN
jgi:acyl carrier protein